MQYQALARKYRPQNFTELVGQEHVTQALVNGLEQGRLHHAFLFTGTRGVGKTTLARIIAKALNCEKGVTGNPCGQCQACQEIAEGRFVDLVEVDAASRTGVDDTRELLENVQYAPSKGRYKIYLIDEVHMFSNSSFNALLKTLEEPPPHVKFLLATTEPAKLPITVLSRCLQFNLKRLDNEQISAHLGHLLEKEGVSYESPALELIARAADGSMRDALSLLDQALAYGAGTITLEDVRRMLGAIEQRHIVDILDAVVRQDAEQLATVMQALFERAPDYPRVLQDLALLLHEISLQQVLGKAPPNSLFDRQAVIDFGNRLDPELTQLYYQICIIGHDEMQRAPDTKTGFEATLVRLFGFTLPTSGGSGRRSATAATGNAAAATGSGEKRTSNSPQRAAQSATPSASAGGAPQGSESPATEPAQNNPPVQAETDNATAQSQGIERESSAPDSGQIENTYPALTKENWLQIFDQLRLKGAARELARHCRIKAVNGDKLVLSLDETHQLMLRDRPRNALEKALQGVYGDSLRLDFAVEATPAAAETVAARDKPAANTEYPGSGEADNRPVTLKEGGPVRYQGPGKQVQDNPLIRDLQEKFNAEIIDVQHHLKRG